MLQINELKNVSVNNIQFTANNIVLLKQTERTNKAGEVNTTIKYVELANVPNNNETKMLIQVLKVLLAEYKAVNDNKSTFEAANVKVNLQIRQLLSNNFVIWKTNNDGKLSKAIVSEIPLNKTALYLKDTHTLLQAKKENLKAALYNHAKAVLMQCSYFSLVSASLQAIDGLLQLTDSKQETSGVQRNRKSVPETKQAVNG